MSDWSDELLEWLKPFLSRLGHKARRRMCPLYVAGLIGPGDRKSVGPMAERTRGLRARLMAVPAVLRVTVKVNVPLSALLKVWLNGKPIGISHGSAMSPFELDATGAVQAGKNVITVCVANLVVNELGTGGILAPVIRFSGTAAGA